MNARQSEGKDMNYALEECVTYEGIGNKPVQYSQPNTENRTPSAGLLRPNT